MTDSRDIPWETSRLIQILDERRNEWTHAKVISNLSREHVTTGKPWDRRSIAYFANMADGCIIGSTTKGYKLLRHATDEEIKESFYENMKKALGTERRARRIMHYARSHGRLQDRNFEETIVQQISQELEATAKPASSSTKPSSKTEPLKQVTFFP